MLTKSKHSFVGENLQPTEDRKKDCAKGRSVGRAIKNKPTYHFDNFRAQIPSKVPSIHDVLTDVGVGSRNTTNLRTTNMDCVDKEREGGQKSIKYVDVIQGKLQLLCALNYISLNGQPG